MLRPGPPDQPLQEIGNQSRQRDRGQEIAADPADPERLQAMADAGGGARRRPTLEQKEGADDDDPVGLAEIGQHQADPANGWRHVIAADRTIEQQEREDHGVDGDEQTGLPTQVRHAVTTAKPAFLKRREKGFHVCRRSWSGVVDQRPRPSRGRLQNFYEDD